MPTSSHGADEPQETLNREKENSLEVENVEGLSYTSHNGEFAIDGDCSSAFTDGGSIATPENIAEDLREEDEGYLDLQELAKIYQEATTISEAAELLETSTYRVAQDTCNILDEEYGIVEATNGNVNYTRWGQNVVQELEQ